MRKPTLVLTAIAIIAVSLTATALATRDTTLPLRSTYQGKTAEWWAKRAVIARKDANASHRSVKRMERTLRYNPTIEESIRLATIVYPAFTQHRAWCIIRHESWMTKDPIHARNIHAWPPGSSEHATGLYQFLPSTFHSTPFGSLSIYSAFAQSLAAGWMHQHGRAGEWAISC